MNDDDICAADEALAADGLCAMRSSSPAVPARQTHVGVQPTPFPVTLHAVVVFAATADVDGSFRGTNAKVHSLDVRRATASLRWCNGSFTDDVPTSDLLVVRPAPIRAPPPPPLPAFRIGPSLRPNGGRGAFAVRRLEPDEWIADYTTSTFVETKAEFLARSLTDAPPTPPRSAASTTPQPTRLRTPSA